MQEDTQVVRLDKWLWAARFFKSRSLATQAIELGRIHVNGDRVKPSRQLKVGEKVQIQRGHERLEVFVRFLGDVRRSAPLAQLLYDETIESRASREAREQQRRFYTEPARNMVGRPTKRNRRAIERFASDDWPV